MADDEKKDDEKKVPHWQWILKHVVVPIATAMIAAGAVQVQATAKAAEEKAKAAGRSAAQDAALKALLERMVEDQAGAQPAVDPTDPPPPAFDLPEEPPAPMDEFIDYEQMQQIQGDPVLLGEAREQFLKEWTRVKAGIPNQLEQRRE